MPENPKGRTKAPTRGLGIGEDHILRRGGTGSHCITMPEVGDAGPPTRAT